VIPCVWRYPVLDTILVPAHAQCSFRPISLAYSEATTGTASPDDRQGIISISLRGNRLHIVDTDSEGLFIFDFGVSPPIFPFTQGTTVMLGPVSDSNFSESIELSIQSPSVLRVFVQRTYPSGDVKEFDAPASLCGLPLG